MAVLQVKQWCFAGSGIGVSIWRGNKNDFRPVTWPTAMKRSNVPFLWVNLRGSVKYTILPPGIGNHIVTGPMHSSEELPDIIPGDACSIFTEDNSMQICAGPINAGGSQIWMSFPSKKLVTVNSGNKITLQQGHVLVHCNPDSPKIYHAKTQDTILNSIDEGLYIEVWRTDINPNFFPAFQL